MPDNSYFYAYGDETGDVGFAFERGSSRYFAIALVLTNHPDCIGREIQNLRLTLGLSSGAEFRFHDMKNNYRNRFLATIQPLLFTAYVLVIDKTKLEGHWRQIGNSAFYAGCLIQLIRHIPPHYLDGTILTLDQFGSIPATKLAIRRELKQLGRRPFKRIRMKRSRGNDLIQCADMVAGAVMQSWQHQNKQFLHLIDSKVAVWEYPDNKNPPS